MKTPKASKFFLKHKAALDMGLYGEGLIRSFRQALHADARRSRGYRVSSVSPKCTNAELIELLDLMASKPPRIEDGQASKGFAWLYDQCRTPKGALRKNNPFGAYETHVIDNFSHFTLADWIDVGKQISFYLPVYEVHSKDGKSFKYYTQSWQSGGAGLEIL